MPSKFWIYFLKQDGESTATCKKCLKVISLKGNTTNLKQHLQRHHPALYITLNQSNNSDDTNINER